MIPGALVNVRAFESLWYLNSMDCNQPNFVFLDSQKAEIFLHLFFHLFSAENTGTSIIRKGIGCEMAEEGNKTFD